ncbi:MFS general substrate transporter [Punctularia strigosozonata HHB-11173 SS5]|uniref:MFS general substrate transporter n=1 Tax=Punctularia strigosozonata (strain HHB-11173) TaxID=741275 RepID=UPI0004416785|nr:MFS general substrate transporter [Punctularia strigosozonata HHB-11173 SS5]EIN05407.1 MFS general substrate transporter [Punctularia strigosozonata HHB-11173 SS5]
MTCRPNQLSFPGGGVISEKGKRGSGSDEEEGDIIVDWDGPDDPHNPRNWTFRRKWAATVIVSAFTFISPVSSSMIAPAAGQVAEQFGITSSVVLAMSISVFVLAYAIGPLFLGPLSEIYGRSRVLQLANIWYLVWNLVCGWSTSTGMLIAFRFLAGLGGSAPLSIGGGVLGDCWDTSQRGQAIAVYSLAPLLGPVVGPIAGAWIAEKSTWRWVFWSTSIMDGAIQCLGLIYLQETYVPVLLERKAAKIRKEMYGHSSQKKLDAEDAEKVGPKRRRVRTKFEGVDRTWKVIFQRALTRPFLLFAREPIIQLLGVYMAFIYGTLYLFLTTIPDIFQGIYHQRVGIAGLHYIALGVGLTGASQINARLLDRIYLYFTNRNGGKGRPEYRLPSMVPGTILQPIGLFLTGWAVQERWHWIVADVGIAFVGAGQILNFQSIQTYVIDAFTLHAASALAAVSCLRSLAGFGFPLFAPAMYKALGYGKGDSILAAAAIVIGCPAPWLFWIYGERIRKASKYARDD